MEINLETNEEVKVVIDGTCEFNVWGERNEEGTMIIEYKRHDALSENSEVKDGM